MENHHEKKEVIQHPNHPWILLVDIITQGKVPPHYTFYQWSLCTKYRIFLPPNGHHMAMAQNLVPL